MGRVEHSCGLAPLAPHNHSLHIRCRPFRLRGLAGLLVVSDPRPAADTLRTSTL